MRTSGRVETNSGAWRRINLLDGATSCAQVANTFYPNTNTQSQVAMAAALMAADLFQPASFDNEDALRIMGYFAEQIANCRPRGEIRHCSPTDAFAVVREGGRSPPGLFWPLESAGGAFRLGFTKLDQP